MTTTSTIALAELAEKGADVDVLRQMVQFMAQRLMELDVEGRCGAGYDEKSAERVNSRNGYRDRTWETRAGSVELKIPKLRQGSYFPESLEPRRTAEKALTAVIQGAVRRDAPSPGSQGRHLRNGVDLEEGRHARATEVADRRPIGCTNLRDWVKGLYPPYDGHPSFDVATTAPPAHD
jgi:hypothetical protein